MTEQQVIAQGYIFQGGFALDKAEADEKAVRLRRAGNKAVVVKNPKDSLSRGFSGSGYSVYWIESAANRKASELARLERKMTELESRKAKLMEEYADLDRQLAEVAKNYGLTCQSAE